MRLLAILLSALLLAGCATQAAPAPPSATPAEAPAPLETLDGDPSPSADPAAAPSTWTERSLAIAHAGRTEGELCVGLIASEECVIPTPAEGSPFELPVVDRPTRLDVTITIDEPLHARGCGWAVLRIQDGDGWRSLGPEGRIVLGASPLEASWSLEEYPAGSAFHLAIYCGRDNAAPPLFLYHGWQTPFQLEATLTHRE